MQPHMLSVRLSVSLSVCSTRNPIPSAFKFYTLLGMVLLTPKTVVQMFRTKPIQHGGQIKMAAV